MKDISATVIVDLLPSEEEIFKKLHKDARWGVRKAKKEKLIVEESDNWKEFYKIYKKTQIEGGNVPKSLNFLRKTSDKLFICKKEGKIIGGAAIKVNGLQIPRLRFNASLKEYQKFQPNNLLYWHCILWAKQKGYSQFDLGGWQINARGHLIGINKFKEKWGKVVFYKKEYPFFKAIGRKLIRKFKFFWWINNKIREIKNDAKKDSFNKK